MSSGPSRAGNMTGRRLGWAVLAGGLLLIWPLQRTIDRTRGEIPRSPDALLLSSGKVMRALCLGYDGLMADIYWTRVVQYFGRKRLARAEHMTSLGPLLRMTTDLDPHLLIAYRFGAIFLAEKSPMGAGEPQQALQLLRRGIVENPAYWRLWQDLGFIYYWDLKDYPAAARAFRAGSEQPGAMIWMRTLAASIAAKGGELQTSRLLWEQVYRTAGNGQIRRSAQDHLAAIEAQSEILQLDARLEAFQKQQGRAAHSLDDLVRAGYLLAIPADPSGAPYVLDKNGKAALSAKSTVDLNLAE